VRRLLDTILSEGLEHHTALVAADVRDDLRRVALWLGIETIDVDGGATTVPAPASPRNKRRNTAS